jgi:mono/diheme cytochrome c family protein
MHARNALGLAISFAAACASGSASTPSTRAGTGEGDAGGSHESNRADPSSVTFDIAAQQPVDAAASARGRAALTRDVLGAGWVPSLAIDNLWIVWGDLAPPPSAEYFARFRDRYGLFEAPFDNGKYPLGLRAKGSSVAFDCLMCHADRIAGKTVLGVGNSRLDLRGLYDDLAKLAELAPQYGFPPSPPPEMNVHTLAAGTNDAMGLGLALAARAGGNASLHTDCGGQQAPAWWTTRYRSRLYLDGSGSAGSTRTMMATLLASGESLASLQAKDATFQDLYQYILSFDPPAWSATELDRSRQTRGKAVFEATCASCHGVQSGPSAEYPNRVVSLADVKTDPVRARCFDDGDAAYIDASWFGEDAPMTATGGYLPPPLRGVWATAPYFHNGSVPDLEGVLDSKKRPSRWRRTGSEAEDYDLARVGWRTTTPAAGGDPSSIDGRRVVDTSRAGMGNGGHEFGDALADADREDLLEYLRGL